MPEPRKPIHRTSVTFDTSYIYAHCTCGIHRVFKSPSGTTEFNKKWVAIRAGVEKHWWKKHAKRRLYGPDWRIISPHLPTIKRSRRHGSIV